MAKQRRITSSFGSEKDDEPLTKKRFLNSDDGDTVDSLADVYSIDDLISIVKVEEETEGTGINCAYDESEDPIPGDPLANDGFFTTTDVHIIQSSSTEEELEQISHVELDVIDTKSILEPKGIIESLVKHRFISSAWSDEERANIIVQGMPKVIHTDAKWEAILPALLSNSQCTLNPAGDLIFCWPCLLFTNHTGFQEPHQVRSHTKRSCHFFSVERLAIWQCKTKKAITISDLHGYARKHQNLFRQLIDVICHLGGVCSFEEVSGALRLALLKDPSLTKYCIYGDPGPDQLMEQYYQALQSSVILAMRCRIAEEVRKAKMVMLIIENPPTINNRYCVSVVIRYDFESTIRERFVRFIKIDKARSEMIFLNKLFLIVEFFDCTNKVVGFAYDSTVFNPTKIGYFNKKASLYFPNARFFHYYKHSVKYLIHQSLCMVTSITDFTCGLTRLTKLFESRGDLRSQLNQDGTVVPWDFSYDFVIILANSFPRFFNLLLSMNSQRVGPNLETNVEASFFIQFLKDLRNRFLIILFARILSDTDDLESVFEGTTTDFSLVKSEFVKTIKTLRMTRDAKFDDIWTSSVQVMDGFVINPQSNCLSYSKLQELQSLHRSLVDNVLEVLTQRIQSIRESTDSELSLLFESSNMTLRSRCRPMVAIEPNFRFDKLYTQIQYLKNKALNLESGFDNLVKHLKQWSEGPDFSEFLKLASLFRSMPMKSLDAVGVPASTRISKYARNIRKSISVDEEFFVIEQELLTEMRGEMTFYDDVLRFFFS